MLLSYWNRKIFHTFLRQPIQLSVRSILIDTYRPTRLFKSEHRREDQCPVQSDVLIIGGGLVGMSVAFWLRWFSKISVTVVERDPTYACSASFLGRAPIRQQFSEPEKIQMSLFTIDFLRNIGDYLRVQDDVDVDIKFNPQGCLLLANTAQADKMREDYVLQTQLGAKVELLSKNAIQERWPWLNVADVELGCYGYENEGWFDPSLLLKALHKKCQDLGVNFVNGELVGFESSYDFQVRRTDIPDRMPIEMRPLRDAVIVRPQYHDVPLTFSFLINAAGPWSGDVARMAEIGNTGHLHIPLPVIPRFQRFYVVRPRPVPQSSSTPPPIPCLDTPFIMDHTRICVKRMGLSGDFLVYSMDDETDRTGATDDPQELSVDRAVFQEKLAPKLGHRIPGMASVDLRSAWTSVCDYNTIDQNLIIGSHSFHHNMYFCSGSSGHGVQHAIAIGRAICELVTYGYYRTIDLTRFSFDRFYMMTQPVKESILYWR